MEDFRFKLEKYNGLSTRHQCPNCENKKSFTFYIDENNEPLNSRVGRCEKIDKCNYHFTPSMWFRENGTTARAPSYTPKVTAAIKPTSFIDKDIFNSSLSSYERNNFFIYLMSIVGIDKAIEVSGAYKLGTSNHFNDACIFWQIDLDTNIRTGKIMGYNPITGKRIKKPFNQITWAHTALKLDGFELKQCLFGLHLIKDNDKAICCVVESEKTAMIASVYLPQFIWLACGSLQNLNKAKCEILKGRKVVLYPDVKGFKLWNDKAKELGFKCSSILEHNASNDDIKNGSDIADFLIRINKPTAFATENTEIENKIILPIDSEQPLKVSKIWDIPDFNNCSIPDTLRLDTGTLINDVSKCINSHLTMVNANIGNKAYYPYLLRLNSIHAIIKNFKYEK